MAEFKSVTKAEFDAFIASYPRKLECNVTGIAEPPFVTYNDFERAPYWPDSIVASHLAYTSYENPEPTRHRILLDINSPVDDDGTRDTATPLFDKNGREVKEGDMIVKLWGGGTSKFSPWGGPFDFSVPSAQYPDWRDHFRMHLVKIRDKGTKYERWSFDDCANNLRGSDFEVVIP